MLVSMRVALCFVFGSGTNAINSIKIPPVFARAPKEVRALCTGHSCSPARLGQLRFRLRDDWLEQGLVRKYFVLSAELRVAASSHGTHCVTTFCFHTLLRNPGMNLLQLRTP